MTEALAYVLGAAALMLVGAVLWKRLHMPLLTEVGLTVVAAGAAGMSNGLLEGSPLLTPLLLACGGLALIGMSVVRQRARRG